ncbi:MAG: hypothetical protein GXO42_01415 [bacterium]|nr:hypothetical protein [bacterium]
MQEEKILRYARFLQFLFIIDITLMFIEAVLLVYLPFPAAVKEFIDKHLRYCSFIYENPKSIFYIILLAIFLVIFNTAKQKGIKYGVAWIFFIHALLMALYDVCPAIRLLHIVEIIYCSVLLYNLYS